VDPAEPALRMAITPTDAAVSTQAG